MTPHLFLCKSSASNQKRTIRPARYRGRAFCNWCHGHQLNMQGMQSMQASSASRVLVFGIPIAWPIRYMATLSRLLPSQVIPC